MSTALKLLALLLFGDARARARDAGAIDAGATAGAGVGDGGDGRRGRERAGRVQGGVRRRGVRAGVRGERGGDVREQVLGELRVRARIARKGRAGEFRGGRRVREPDAVSESFV